MEKASATEGCLLSPPPVAEDVSLWTEVSFLGESDMKQRVLLCSDPMDASQEHCFQKHKDKIVKDYQKSQLY